MESFEQCLNAVKDYCRLSEAETIYNLWLKGLEPVSYDDGKATLSVSTAFIKSTVEERYLPLLKRAFSQVMGFDIEIKIVSRAEMPGDEGEKSGAQSFGPEGQYTFENFIVGQDNRFAHAAAQAVAASPASTYNPLFIYGAPGLGKTHLLLAIKNSLTKTHPQLKVIYIGGDQFTNELIAAISSGSTEAFHDKFRSADVLLVDDVQFIGGKEATQEEFFHTFNALHNDHKQIVISSDRPPKEIKSLEERLRTRFEWGLLADVQPPDVETRISIIYRKAEQLGLKISSEVAEYIAVNVKNDVRQLEGAVKKLGAYYQMDGISPSIGLAQNAIRDILSEQQPIPVTVEKIVNEVARTYNVSPEDIRSAKQNASVSLPRQVAMYIVREVTGMTMERIGAEFGGRNHATVVYGTSKVEKLMQNDTRTKELIEDIIKNSKT
ncbi:MAG: chromosomal replication initiator protein DnaA [Oscillospiraceae bacterium]|nr:chromosomal replication initiator protein DnaA [Oscillospiraceae bacterium]